MHTARFGERLPRLQIQFRISRSFRPRNLANLGSKIRFWIRRKEHTLGQILTQLRGSRKVVSYFCLLYLRVLDLMLRQIRGVVPVHDTFTFQTRGWLALD